MAAARPHPPPDIAPEQFFTAWIPKVVRDDPSRVARLGATEAVLEFNLEGDGGGAFQLHVRDGQVTGAVGAAKKPNVRLTLDLPTWRQLNSGELSAPEAFLRRRVKLEGNLALAMKLHFIIG
jgi:putative sterol carrier protein